MIFERRKELLILGSIIIVTAILLWPGTEEPPAIITQISSEKVEIIEQKAVAKAMPVAKRLRSKMPEPLKSVTVDEGMQHEMLRVADIYEQRSKYAPYSLFLSNQQSDLIQPNQSHESPRAYDIDGQNVSILIKPKNYRFSVGQAIEVDVQVTSSKEGLKSMTGLAINLVATVSKEQWPLKTANSRELEGSRSIQAVFDTSSEIGSLKESDYSVVVSASFNNESPIRQSAPIKIVNSIAEITGLGSNRIENNDLIIPIKIEADKAGYYQVSASLFDLASNSAISFLIAKERLSSGSNSLEAKVQGLVLRDKGFSGPFRLQGITLVKKSERPGMPEEYGISAESYEVDAVELNDFESIPYEDPMTEQRLEFMRSIGQ